MGKPFVVYNASAGSGKTYQLVLSYLSIFLKPGQAKRFKNILAITFTNAASKEMLERVLRGIKEISTPGESELKKEMAQKLGCTEQDLEKSALQALQAMLHNYSQIGIKTIDSFTTRVVKIFAEDLNFPPDFEVNLNPQALLEEFSAELIAVYGEDKEVSTMIDQWIDINLEQGKKINDPQKYLVDFLQKNISGKNRQYLDQFLANTKNKKQISEHIKSRTEEIKEKLFVLAEDVQSFTSQHGLRQEHFGGKSTCGLDKMIKAWKETNWDVNIGVTFPKTFISSDNPWHKDVGRKFDHLTEEILSRVRKAHDYFLAHKGEFYLLSSIQKQLPFLNSSAEILRRYDNFCYTKKQITLDRISDRISELLENNPTPYIYEKIGNAYRHILIDEFQDTSVQAWENFLPLVSNAISQGGSTTVVGDAKQSIYRFTGAEVGQIVSLPKLLSESPSAAEHENLLSASYQAVDLDKNYRSGYEIVAFNNDFLEHMAPFMDNEFQAYYLNGKQEAIKKYPGYLEVSYLQEKENTQEEQFDFLLKSIQKCFDNGISPNDINVLAKNKKELKEFQEFLKHHEIPSYSEENNFLIEHPYAEVIFLALRFLCNREKEPSLVRMLSLLHNINDKVFNLSSSYNDLLEISGYNVKLKPGAIADFFSLENFWSRESLTEKVLHLYQQFSFDRELPALRQFFQVCMDYETTQGSNLNDFINHLEKNKEDFPLASAESDSIILRTVHKSKGLSLHTVIMPHLSWQKKGNHVKEEWIRIPSSMPISQLCPIAQIELKSTKLKDTEFWNYVIAEKHNEFIDDLNLYYVG
ncbi:MAG: UvrD-helicase domain-containing protein, partial [Luteibaculum sp.]